MKRIFPIILLISFLSYPLFAGYIEEVNGKTIIHVKVCRLPDPTRTDAFNRAGCAAVKAFVEKFPEIFAKKYRAEYKANPEKYGNYNWDSVEIQLERFSGIYVEGIETDLLAVAGDMAPDILYLCFRKSDNYIRNGFLYPLDKYFREMSKKQIDFRIHKKLWPVIKRKGPGGKEHIWAMPYGGPNGHVLLYRKDLFDENGLKYPDKNWTWNDMLAACKKITDPAKGIYGLRLFLGKHESYSWISYLWSAGDVTC
ncbi:MAG: extracellular solute-binding protein [Victivallaceae bacterium]|nr:extracellular solute-binding protein [Victivallaceae bacterium]